MATSGTGGNDAPVSDQAVAYHISPTHTGAQDADTLAPPLTQRWSRALGGPVSYPLIAEGRVFVTVSNADAQMTSLPGSKLYALDQATGKNLWGPIDLGGKGMALSAYDAGQVFAVNSEGVTQAFDAATGKVVWSVDLKGLSAFTSPPTPAFGMLYIVGGAVLSAVRQSTGKLVWAIPLQASSFTSPVVSGTGVYVALTETCVHNFDPVTGKSLWEVYVSCGDGGRTPALFDGTLYVRNPPIGIKENFLVDVVAQKETGTFAAEPIPAFHANRGFFLATGTLSAKDLPAQTEAWSFKGDGMLASAPIVVNGRVYVGATSGKLYALDEKAGSTVWSTDVGAPILAPNEDQGTHTITGLAAGGGALIVPASDHLVAYW